MEELIINNLKNINALSLKSLTNEDNNSIIENFAAEGERVLGADSAFAWGRVNEGYQLVYKTRGTSYTPKTPPLTKNGYFADKLGYLLFDTNVKKENYEGDISKHFKSYIMIPIRYGDHVFGSIVLCYKKPKVFSDRELILSETIGTTVGRAVTINWFIEKAQAALALTEKQKETEVSLQQEKLRTEFIQNASHELRTPLAIMKGNIDLALIQGVKDESTKEVLDIVNTEIKHLSNIIEDLSILTSEGRLANEAFLAARVDLSSLLANTVKRLRTLAKEKNISLKLKDGENFEVNGDAKYLEKLFLNIIKNAINYGKEGGEILVETEVKKETVEIKITDDGIGIKAEELPKIFERFFRTEDARELRKKGIGLGLAIVEWVTKIHGGTINVESKYGKGTTFVIELPLAKN